MLINLCDSLKKEEQKMLLKSSAIFNPQIASVNGNRFRSIAKNRLKSGNALSIENEESNKPFIVKKKIKKFRKSGEKISSKIFLRQIQIEFFCSHLLWFSMIQKSNSQLYKYFDYYLNKNNLYLQSCYHFYKQLAHF